MVDPSTKRWPVIQDILKREGIARQHLNSFDELLDTWMGVCRGSGVIELVDKKLKIKHYVLSLTIPNDIIDDVIKMNSKEE